MDLVMFHSYWTVLLLVVFIAIGIWAYSGKRRQAFKDAARIPLEEDKIPPPKENLHG